MQQLSEFNFTMDYVYEQCCVQLLALNASKSAVDFLSNCDTISDSVKLSINCSDIALSKKVKKLRCYCGLKSSYFALTGVHLNANTLPPNIKTKILQMISIFYD